MIIGVPISRNHPDRPVEDLLNIGPKTAALLRAAGVADEKMLRKVGPVATYRRLKHENPRSVNIICLYALYGALTETHWNSLPDEVIDRLRSAAGAKEETRR